VSVEWGGLRLGLTLCEDIWNFEGFHEQEGYRRNPVQELAHDACDVFVVAA